jgi:hypothetical protein
MGRPSGTTRQGELHSPLDSSDVLLCDCHGLHHGPYGCNLIQDFRSLGKGGNSRFADVTLTHQNVGISNKFPLAIAIPSDPCQCFIVQTVGSSAHQPRTKVWSSLRESELAKFIEGQGSLRGNAWNPEAEAGNDTPPPCHDVTGRQPQTRLEFCMHTV